MSRYADHPPPYRRARILDRRGIELDRSTPASRVGHTAAEVALRYALNRRDGLVRSFHDGRIELDTDAVERATRSVEASRKDAFFAGGGRAVAITSLLETAKSNGIDPATHPRRVPGIIADRPVAESLTLELQESRHAPRPNRRH